MFLAMGGIALGKGVTSSGLLDIMGELIRDLVQDFELYSVVLILSPIVLVCFVQWFQPGFFFDWFIPCRSFQRS